MLHLVMGVCWLILGLVLMVYRESLQAQGQSPTMLVVFAGLLATYNFVRCGLAWLSRRQLAQSNLLPKCPRCGRPMRLEGDLHGGAESTCKFVCCGYEVHIEDDEERRAVIKMMKGRRR